MIDELVTIGLCSSDESSLLYTISTIFAQGYQNIEVIISVDEVSGISFGKIVDCIGMHNANRGIRVQITYNQNPLGKMGGVKYILDRMEGHYLILLFDSAAFYERDSLYNLMSLFDKELLLVGDTVLYDCYPGKYKGQVLSNINSAYFNEADVQKLCCVYRADEIKKVFKRVRQECENDYILSLFLIRYLTSLNKKQKIRYEKINVIRKNEPENIYRVDKMNYSAMLSIKSFTEKILENRNNIVLKNRIKNIVQTILNKQNGSEWNMGDSDSSYIICLQKILKIIDESGHKRKYDLKILETELKNYSDKKIKLVFLTMEYSVWPSLMPVYNQAKFDLRYEVQIVYLPFSHANKTNSYDDLEKYQKNGYSIINYEDYDLSTESPDIAFVLKPYDSVPSRFYINQLQKVVPRCIYIPYGMEVSDAEHSLSYQCLGAVHFLSWKVLAWGPAYYEKMKKYTYNYGENYLPIGHPRIDIEVENDQKLEKKILLKGKGKKVVLWNTHFSFEGDIACGSYFDWGEDILQLARKNKEILLLWRPHPLFYGAYAKKRNMNIKEVMDWFHEWDLIENIVIDDTESYLTSFNLSDALITDATSFIPEYLCQEKPILFTPKTYGAGVLDKTLEHELRRVTSAEDIKNFFDDLINGKPMKILEKKKYLYMPDSGSVSESLLDYIYEQLLLENGNSKSKRIEGGK